MYKVIVLNDKKMELMSNAATPIRYKQIFRKDLLTEFTRLDGKSDDEKLQAIDTIQQLAFVMNKQATASREEINRLNYDSFVEWLEDFEADAFYQKEIMDAVINTWFKNNKSTSISKN